MSQRLVALFALVLVAYATPTLVAAHGAAAVVGVTRVVAIGNASDDWVAAINRYRTAAGLAPVSANPAWDAGIENHLTYLEKTPASYMTGRYASAHTENPLSPYYTPSGATEASFSDLAWDVSGSPVSAINDWMAAPFHAIGILRSQLKQVAFAMNGGGAAGLDILHGLDTSTPPAASPILFPGPHMTTNLVEFFGGERPNPAQTCGWQTRANLGLPLIALLPQRPAAGLSAALSGPTGIESDRNGGLCVVDSWTYYSSDPTYGPTGSEILSDDNAVILIPSTELEAGEYTATISQPGRPTIQWSFNVRV